MACRILRGETEVYDQSYLKAETFLIVTIGLIYYLTSVYHNPSLFDYSHLVQTEKQFNTICLVFHRSYPSLIKTLPGPSCTFHTRFPAHQRLKFLSSEKSHKGKKKVNLPVGQFITLYNSNIHKILTAQNH